ncbi:hypothetical protein HU200_057833 [Digitaria exilis]|uniref:Auxin-responsive protein n=1 Tax=Digitaria exilis TaxID=1010633 RepID=A0A835E3Y3_9POAL|nr:hypothetical protein HU200_057833 [Digitaria exilis]CAB3486008.1 unnamed protein product [Digitaria exilis]
MSSGGGAASASASFEQHGKRRPPAPPGPSSQQQQRKLRLKLSVQQDDDVVPPVTVVLDGRCICHRVHLNRHTGYRSLAAALRRMFVDDTDAAADDGEDGLDLANAIPGHVVAYEDMEDDLLLAGDLKWNDFVRVAKRIRIIPAKKSSRTKKCGGGLDN